MVKIPENIRNVVEDYLKDLSDDIRIDKAIIFGSYAKGNYNIDSDIDLAIFSDSFKDMDRVESIKYLLNLGALIYNQFLLQHETMKKSWEL